MWRRSGRGARSFRKQRSCLILQSTNNPIRARRQRRLSSPQRYSYNCENLTNDPSRIDDLFVLGEILLRLGKWKAVDARQAGKELGVRCIPTRFAPTGIVLRTRSSTRPQCP